MSKDPQSAWIANLSPENKKKVFKISMQTMMEDPNFNLMGGESAIEKTKISDETANKLVNRLINENDEIADALLSSIDSVTKDKDSANFLKSSNAQWKDWDFNNLNVSQKK